MEFYFLRGLAVILLQFVHPPAHQHIWPTRIKGRRRFLQGHHFSGCNTGTTQQNSLDGSAAWTPPPFMANVQNLLTALYEADRYNDIILPQMTNWAEGFTVHGCLLTPSTMGSFCFSAQWLLFQQKGRSSVAKLDALPCCRTFLVLNTKPCCNIEIHPSFQTLPESQADSGTQHVWANSKKNPTQNPVINQAKLLALWKASRAQTAFETEHLQNPIIKTKDY